MPDAMFAIKITAVGEVRDKDGNLLNSEPVELTGTATEEVLRELIEKGTK